MPGTDGREKDFWIVSGLGFSCKEGGPQPITTPISEETLAEIIGTTRPRVSMFMNKFRKLGFIDYNGHLEVHTSLVSVLLRE